MAIVQPAFLSGIWDTYPFFETAEKNQPTRPESEAGEKKIEKGKGEHRVIVIEGVKCNEELVG